MKFMGGKRVYLVTVGLGGPGMGRRLKAIGKFICDQGLRDAEGRLQDYNLPLKCQIGTWGYGYGYRVRVLKRVYKNGKLHAVRNRAGGELTRANHDRAAVSTPKLEAESENKDGR